MLQGTGLQIDTALALHNKMCSRVVLNAQRQTGMHTYLVHSSYTSASRVGAAYQELGLRVPLQLEQLIHATLCD